LAGVTNALGADGGNRQTGVTTRVTKFEPSAGAKSDPMQYGAYRRWKIVEEEKKGKLKSSLKRKKSSKGDGKNPAQKFYDAIKNLGSGPVSNNVRNCIHSHTMPIIVDVI